MENPEWQTAGTPGTSPAIFALHLDVCRRGRAALALLVGLDGGLHDELEPVGEAGLDGAGDLGLADASDLLEQAQDAVVAGLELGLPAVDLEAVAAGEGGGDVGGGEEGVGVEADADAPVADLRDDRVVQDGLRRLDHEGHLGEERAVRGEGVARVEDGRRLVVDLLAGAEDSRVDVGGGEQRAASGRVDGGGAALLRCQLWRGEEELVDFIAELAGETEERRGLLPLLRRWW